MKSLPKYILAISMLTNITSYADDQPIKVFYTGNDYLKIIDTYTSIKGIEKLYISGLNDSVVIYHADGLDWINKCTLSKTPTQLAAIFYKWLKANPERWDEPAPILYIDSLGQACAK